MIDFTSWPFVDGHYTLFNGEGWEATWRPFVDSKLGFEAAASVGADGFSAKEPEEQGWGVFGLISAKPIVWLDQLAGTHDGRMALKAITLDVTMPQTQAWFAPSDDPVDPPLTSLFAPDAAEGWLVEPWAVDKANAKAPCLLDATGFHVEVGDGNFGGYGRGCKLRSEAPAFTTGVRLDHGDLGLFFTFDPARRSTFWLVLSPYR